MRQHIGMLAVCATAALAWGAIPDLPATWSVRESTRLDLVVSAMGRTKSTSRTTRSNGTLEVYPDQTLTFRDPRGFFTDTEATWTEAGRSGLRFVLTEDSKTEIEGLLESALAVYGLSGTATGRFSPGRLSFQRQGRGVTGSQVSRVNVRGRYRGRAFALYSTARLSWRGTRTD